MSKPLNEALDAGGVAVIGPDRVATVVEEARAQGYRVLEAGNPLRAPLTLERVVFQIGGDDAAEPEEALRAALATAGRTMLVVGQAETLDDRALLALTRLAAQEARFRLVLAGGEAVRERLSGLARCQTTPQHTPRPPARSLGELAPLRPARTDLVPSAPQHVLARAPARRLGRVASRTAFVAVFLLLVSVPIDGGRRDTPPPSPEPVATAADAATHAATETAGVDRTPAVSAAAPTSEPVPSEAEAAPPPAPPLGSSDVKTPADQRGPVPPLPVSPALAVSPPPSRKPRDQPQAGHPATDQPDRLQADFNAFLDRAGTDTATLTATQRKELFDEYIAWRARAQAPASR